MGDNSLPLTLIPLQVRRPEQSDDDEGGEFSEIQRQRDLQIVSSSPFRLPDDWLVEERPRRLSRTARRHHVDRYYYEPGTGRRFRSLVSVQRYLMEETRDAERVKSEDENTVVTRTMGSTSIFKLPNDWIVDEKPHNEYVGVIDRTYIEPETGQRFRSLRAVEGYLTGEYACSTTLKSSLKSGCGKQRAPGENCCAKAVSKRSKVAEEDGITLKTLKLAIQSKKSGSRKKINLGKDSKASMVNLSSPPAKVNWVLSSSGGFWSPFLDDSIVPESVRLKWSEAFTLYIQDGDNNGRNR